MSLQAGLEAVKQKRFQEAIELLEAFCRNCPDSGSKEYLQAQMGLVKAYQRTDQLEKAIATCRQLSLCDNLQIADWAKETLKSLHHTTQEASSAIVKAKRASGIGVKLAMAGIGGNLVLASAVTITLLFGMVFVLCLAIVFIINSDRPGTGLAFSIGLTLLFNLAAFFLSPFLMDLTQSWLYNTRWVDLSEVERQSPEAASVIRRVCTQKQLKQPRLGIIDDQNPTAFTYGSLPNSARLVYILTKCEVCMLS